MSKKEEAGKQGGEGGFNKLVELVDTLTVLSARSSNFLGLTRCKPDYITRSRGLPRKRTVCSGKDSQRQAQGDVLTETIVDRKKAGERDFNTWSISPAHSPSCPSKVRVSWV